MTAAAATKPAAVAAIAHSGPAKPTRTPAMGAPSREAMTCPLLSSAFARSHKWRGARIGNSERAPVLRGKVNEDAKTTTRSRAGGRA